MKLADWMAAGALTPEQLAKELGVTGEAVRRYRAGARMPRVEQIAKIHELSGGLVTAQDFHEQRLAYLSPSAA